MIIITLLLLKKINLMKAQEQKAVIHTKAKL